MRYREILSELKMSPSNLRKIAAASGNEILAGFEAECVISGVIENVEQRADLTQDSEIDVYTTPLNIRNFFNVPRAIGGNHPFREMERDYEAWQEEKIQEYIEERYEDYATEMAEKYNARQDDEDDYLKPTDFEDEAREGLRGDAENNVNLDFSEFCSDKRISTYYELSKAYDFDWPFMTSSSEDWDSNVAKDLAISLSRRLGKQVESNDSYHGERYDNSYVIEPDTSIDRLSDEDMAIEIISYPMQLEEMISDLEKVISYIQDMGYTNSSTGLHVSMSIPGKEIDYTKLILFLGDKYVLELFGRQANTYAKNTLDRFSSELRKKTNKGEAIMSMLDQMKNGMMDQASISSALSRDLKYVSVNMKEKYVEFRSMGGEYADDLTGIMMTIRRYAAALKVACDPEAERKEYARKLYKVLAANTDAPPDILKAFSLYNSKAMDKYDLKEYLKRQRQSKQPPGTE